MRKFLSVILLLLLITATVFAGDEAFYSALENCKSYSGSGQTKTEGAVARYKSQILGWENDKCVYQEKVNFSGVDSCTTCRLSKNQIAELVKVMRAYSTLQGYSDENIDTSSLQNVSGNPVVKVWNKYLMDSSVCTIELSE